jgi:glucose-6-phosphate 1-epimerase
MLCIETANVMGDVAVLAPGLSHTLGVSIGSKPL